MGSLKDDELVVMGIYLHESQDLVSIVAMSKNENLRFRSIIKYEGHETVYFLDELKEKWYWKHVDVLVIAENKKSKEIIATLELENKTVIPVCLTPSFSDGYASKEARDFSLLLNYITNKKRKHLIKFPKEPNQNATELIKQFEKFGSAGDFSLDDMLNNKDDSGDFIWAFLLACHGIMSLEYNRRI